MKIINIGLKNKRTILLVVTFLLFIILTILMLNDNLIILDDIVHNFILSIRNNYLTTILKYITHTATSYTLILFTIILLIVIKNKKIPLFIMLNLIFSFTTNEIVKLIFKRDRPLGINLIEETNYSYPSGHSMVGLAYYGFIIYLINKHIKSKKLKNTLTITLIINILLVGFSRIYLGVHYLTDVIGGFLLGIIYLIIYTNIISLEKK
ncbi:MAG: phosphatase PAP2 family protein [Bacilli bacterium]|nr:phosphatase PAP2 family protein [Bacilli bacterium]